MKHCCEDFYKGKTSGYFTLSMFKKGELKAICGLRNLHAGVEHVRQIFYCPFCGQKLKT